MKPFILIAIFVIWSMISFGQEPETIKVKADTKNGKATYYVLKSDPKTYHGHYTIEAWTGNKKLVEGMYSYGKKEGLWTERYYGYDQERNLKSSGEYKDDIKVGKWVYYSINGDTAQVYDYSTSRFIYSKECKSPNSDCPVLFVGGMDILLTSIQDQVEDYISKLSQRPVGLLEINTDVSIMVDTTGRVADIKFLKEIDKGYEEKITTWIQQQSNLWIPGKLNGKLSLSKITVPVRLKLYY